MVKKTAEDELESLRSKVAELEAKMKAEKTTTKTSSTSKAKATA